ncbi:MAG: ABC transporter substrate-binding protein [bacterium]|nr:ABC transporter substrate-binding protein [bacterium]
MNRKWFRGVAFFILAALGVMPALAQENADQTLFLTFVPNIQFSPVYAGIENGYYAQNGINLIIEHGDEPVGVDLIAAGERQFGIVSGEQVIAARANGRPVVFVYEWFQKFPISVVATENSGIDTVADLAGQRVGLPGRFGATYSGLVALLAANGLAESDLQLQEIGFNAPEVICVGGVEASTVYINNEPLQIQNRIDAGDCGAITGIRVFPVSEYVDIVSNGLITNEATITENPDLVRAMVAAYHNGLRDVIQNPAQAYLISAAYVENLPLTDADRAVLENGSDMATTFIAGTLTPDANIEQFAAFHAQLADTLIPQLSQDAAVQFRILLNTIDLWMAERLGYTDPESWETTAQTLITMGFLDEIPDLAGAYTNDFLPE